ncbi:MAG: hypothetical protein DRP64_14470, partial [Verrucomicrobia bacterium]
MVFGATVGTNAAQSFTEDFSGGVLPAPLELTVANDGTVVNQVSFGGNNAAWANVDSYRQYMRTTDSNYSVADFRFEATITLNGLSSWGDVFFGMGDATPRGDWWWEPGRPVIGMSAESGSTYTRELIYDDAGNISDTTRNAGRGGGAGTHRVRMDWDAETQMATMSIDQNYNGTFVSDNGFTLDGSTVVGGFDASNSHLFIGGGHGIIIDDISIASSLSAFGDW